MRTDFLFLGRSMHDEPGRRTVPAIRRALGQRRITVGHARPVVAASGDAVVDDQVDGG